jgi:hypothetical protein
MNSILSQKKKKEETPKSSNVENLLYLNPNAPKNFTLNLFNIKIKKSKKISKIFF